MTKYIDAEKLKAHIQYLIKKDNYELFDVPELLSFIDSHQQEQPEVDLEKEIDKMWNPCFNLGWDEYSALSMNHEGFVHVARHFFNLGYNVRKEENK